MTKQATSQICPWTDLVKLHPDVEDGKLTDATYALDLGAIAAQDKTVPVVYRDPDEFFRATYLTKDLHKLLDEVLASLSGKTDHNRILKLRTPFGGGKSHTLAALLHAARSRKSLNAIEECKGCVDPGEVDVAVFDGEKFTATGGKEVEKGIQINTMWGWLAWQLGKNAFDVIRKNDEDRVSPSGDEIKAMLNAEGRPALLLLDEVLKYMERASAVSVLDSTLRRQAMDFFQNLTVEVAGSERAVLVFSLQWSHREALQNVALLDEIDGYARRVDQLREPVTGDEVLPILHRRLLGGEPDKKAAGEVAEAYQVAVTGMRRAEAETDSARQQADEDGALLQARIKAAYPFHPALIDVMKERWTAIDGFQRTRGALRFLAACLHTLRKNGNAKAILGPGEIPVKDGGVRMAMLKELGAQNDFDPVITADIDGANARAKKIDDKLARETPKLGSVRPATRMATAILTYSFGGLKRDGDKEAEMLPPGVTEAELFAATVGPDLDNITAKAVLSELRNSCLYLHHDGVRYCFKKDPNVTKLVEDAEAEVGRNKQAVDERIKKMLEGKLAGHRNARIWPADSKAMDDGEPVFMIGYLPLDFATKTKKDQEAWAIDVLKCVGDRHRKYRNGIGLAIPEKKQVEPMRQAVRYLLAVEKVESKKSQHKLSKDQLDQLKERKRTELANAEAAIRALYGSIWLPRIDGGTIEVERVEVGGRPLQATGVHERVWELLTTMTNKVFTSTTPRKLADLMKLGQPPANGEKPRLGISTAEIQDAFFGFLGFTRLDKAEAIRKAIARGVGDSTFGYVSGSVPSLGADDKFEVSLDRLVFGRNIGDDEIDLENGFVIAPSAIPTPEPVEPFGEGADDSSTDTTTSDNDSDTSTTTTSEERTTPARTFVHLAFAATRDQVFGAFPAIANLSDKADGGKVNVEIKADAGDGFDESWLRNAVYEPLDEADIDLNE